MSEIQLFFITDITNLVFAYEHPLNEEWENKLLIKNLRHVLEALKR